MHRLHRRAGALFALWLWIWFASGAVMTFGGYPSFEEQERLAGAVPLAGEVELPTLLAERIASGVLTRGARLRLTMVGSEPSWQFSDGSERARYRAIAEARAEDPSDEQLARAIVAPYLGENDAIADVSRQESPDSWNVALSSAIFPLLRVELASGRLYDVATNNGEIVQESTRGERILAYVGAIPHWVYLTELRRQRGLWRAVVLVLSAIGLLVAVSGLVAGVHVVRATREKTLRDRWLRLHQRLGLGFGLFACAWLFSGALSLAPFGWAGPRELLPNERERVFGGSAQKLSGDCIVRALAACQRQIEVRELELASFAGDFFAVCHAGSNVTRIVVLGAASPVAEEALDDERYAGLARALSPQTPFRITRTWAFDDYYYPTHFEPRRALPYIRLSFADADGTTYYFDPGRARLLARHSDRTRLERWLYHGLHSLDFGWLYGRPWLWRSVLLVAMGAGMLLSGLGAGLALRRARRRARRNVRRPYV